MLLLWNENEKMLQKALYHIKFWIWINNLLLGNTTIYNTIHIITTITSDTGWTLHSPKIYLCANFICSAPHLTSTKELMCLFLIVGGVCGQTKRFYK